MFICGAEGWLRVVSGFIPCARVRTEGAAPGEPTAVPPEYVLETPARGGPASSAPCMCRVGSVGRPSALIVVFLVVLVLDHSWPSYLLWTALCFTLVFQCNLLRFLLRGEACGCVAFRVVCVGVFCGCCLLMCFHPVCRTLWCSPGPWLLWLRPARILAALHHFRTCVVPGRFPLFLRRQYRFLVVSSPCPMHYLPTALICVLCLTIYLTYSVSPSGFCYAL